MTPSDHPPDAHPDRPVIVDDLGSVALEPDESSIYDRPVDLRLLHGNPRTGAVHYLIRYPAGLVSRWHRHTAAHTIVVIEGRLEANGRIVGPHAYCHFPAGVPMQHTSAGDGPCLFVIVFDGPVDAEVLDPPGG